MTRVAVLGTGLLGSAFVEGLMKRGGTEVVAWNRTRARAEPLRETGATVANTIADAVSNVDRVHLVLLDDDTVDEAVRQMHGELPSGAVIVDHTTTRPDRTAARMAALDAAGLKYLHAPVMMGPPAARRRRRSGERCPLVRRRPAPGSPSAGSRTACRRSCVRALSRPFRRRL